jgi:hypothetical protein
VIDEPLGLDELEDVEVVLQRRPRGEGDPCGPERDAGRPDDLREDILSRALAVHAGWGALDGDVQHLRREPLALQEPERRGEAERLVAKLVAGDQQDGARVLQRLGERFVDALLHTSISMSAPVTRTG